METACSHCHAVLGPEIAADWCPGCGGALIERELIIQDFKSSGGFIPDTYTTERINDVIRQEYGGDRVAFVKTLYERGVTMQKYKDEIQNNAIVGYMRNKNVVQTVLVSPYQIEQYYQQNLRLFQQDEQIRVSTIVLRKSLFPSQKTVDGKLVSYDPQEEIANEILYKIDTGSDFAELAKSYGGGIAVRGKESALVPDGAIYRVHLSTSNGVVAAQLRGQVRIEGVGESLINRGLRSAMAVILREWGE